ncbi:MAG: 1-acyl-sn-glycerol-3-phosphate acyltransferase [Flavipsychrobacter sp.]|nr:1-acyl-sn-glycerol-3-phosphate acyltransferase [Flavipsychrobacter sp.]
MKLFSKIGGHLFAVYAIVVFVATMLLVLPFIWVISFLKEPVKSLWLHKVFRFWMGIYMPAIFCPVTRKGKQYFRDGENYVVVLNHNSFMDIPVSSPWIPGPNKTLAKSEMAKIPLFGIIYRSGSILVNRKNEGSRRDSIAKMQEALEMGLHLCLYPEGTRNKTGKPLQPFYDGAFLTAIKAQKPIIPGLIFNTGVILPHNKTAWARPKKIQIHFLEPIDTKGLTINNVAELKEKVRSLMEEYYTRHLTSIS